MKHHMTFSVVSVGPVTGGQTASCHEHDRARARWLGRKSVLGVVLCAGLATLTACSSSYKAELTEENERTQAAALPKAKELPREEEYIAYFAFNSHQLNDAAREVVAEAVASAKERENARIVISGHTDRKGPADYNRKLSRARVLTVASAFHEAGIPASKIEIEIFGEEKPQLQTPDGKAAASNRRAEIRVVKAEISLDDLPVVPAAQTVAGPLDPNACDYVTIWTDGRSARVCLDKPVLELTKP